MTQPPTTTLNARGQLGIFAATHHEGRFAYPHA